MLFLEYVVSGLLSGSAYSLVAIGFTLIFGVLDRLNIAHGATIMVSAFAGAYVCLRLGGGESYLVLLLSFAIASVAGAALGFLVWATAFAPLRNASPLAPFITSAALALILEETVVVLSRTIPEFLPEFSPYPTPLENLVFFVGPILIRGVHVVMFVVALILMAVLQWWIKYSRTGRAIRAVEANPTAAWLMGINVRRVEIIVFVVASAIAGASGCLIGAAGGTVNAFMGADLLLTTFVIVVVAGLGSIGGAMICGLAVGVIETVVVGLVSASAKEAVLFVLLFAVLVLRPEGLMSAPRIGRD